MNNTELKPVLIDFENKFIEVEDNDPLARALSRVELNEKEILLLLKVVMSIYKSKIEEKKAERKR